MASKTVISTIADCKETPKFWDNDEKMQAWFAPFRSKDLNPLNYDNKMAFWKNNIEFFTLHRRKPFFTLTEVKSFFVRNGKTPNCLVLVFEDLLREGIIQTLREYENALSNNTWTGWALNTFVSSPLKWSYKKVMKSVSQPPIEVDENVEYVHLPSLKKQSDDLLKCIVAEAKDSLLTYEDIRTILRQTIEPEVDMRTIKLMVRCLESQNKASSVFSEHCNIDLLKFAVDSQSVAKITDSETSVYVLQFKEKLLIEELQHLEMQKETLQTEVKQFLIKKMRNMAKNTLKKQKELEKRITKLINVLENIQNLLYKVQDTETDSKIIESYQIGTHALKKGISKGGLNLEKVDHTMAEIEEVMDMHNDIQETLGQQVGPPVNDAELENELSDLLLDDIPSVPPDAPSPGRKLIDRSFDELPTVPDEDPQSAKSRVTHVPL